jgi:UDPglucose 6-dehydrogenase/GDP-mannose 6-dehydrogenase
MKISIIGTGYVGLVSGVCLADKGHDVVCVDIDIEKVNQINNGNPPIYEIGLEDMLKRTINKKLSATMDLQRSILESEITLIAVGTPFDGRDIDLSYIKEVSRQIGATLRDKPEYHVVVVKSTVVPGTTDKVVLPLLEQHSAKKAGVDFGVGMNPEFLTEGQAVADFMNPDRIVLGANDERTMHALDQLYDTFKGIPMVKTNCKTAEMIKYVSNALLAVQISFANEIANLCSDLGNIDIVDVMNGVHLSYYLSPRTEQGDRVRAPISSFLEAGCGFGGSCLPKDLNALIAQGVKAGSSMGLLSAILDVNERQPHKILELLKRHFARLKGVKIAILGLSFKPDTDDIRESPAIPIVKALLEEEAVVKAYDPAARELARKAFIGMPLTICETLNETIAGVEAIVLITRWDEFKIIPELLKDRYPQPLVVDGRRLLNKRTIERYEGIGL